MIFLMLAIKSIAIIYFSLKPSQWKSLSQRLRDKGQLEGTDVS